ncbi:MAG: hypothetical protein LQ348_002431 [Seirophora lacunosa]|nr:MAG: hypothetical protein LQ348_002431 [Seirophora lacunosa]
MSSTSTFLGYLVQSTGDAVNELEEGFQIVLPDPTISNVHLRIYSIRYNSGVEPFVYAENLSANGAEWLRPHNGLWEAYPIPTGKAILLSSGEKLRLCDQTIFTFQTRLPASQLLTSTQLQEKEDPDCRQVLEKAIQLYIIRRDGANKRPSYIIEELITGGDLMSYIERHEWRVDPEESCLIVYQTLKAVAYLHGKGITHRDLKPENILMSNTSAGARVVVTDFGGATKAIANSEGFSRMQTITGTFHYLAPEIRGRNSLVQQPGYTSAVDMWSVGCVTAAMLIGRPAFAMSQASTGRQDSTAVVIAAAARCDLRVLDDPDIWGDIDEQAKDFIRRLLVLDERARFTAQQALLHGWFTQMRHRAMTDSYDQAIAGWKRSVAGWDFKEHLDCFIEARISESDASTYDTLLQSNCTSCEIQDDLSAYWTPPLYYQHSNGSFEEVPHGGMTVYYLGRGDDRNIQPFPPGFRMVSGNPGARSYNQKALIPGSNRPIADRVSFACLHTDASKEQPGMVDTNCKNGLRAQIHFQSCWNGKDLYKPDNSHVEYMSGLDNGICPRTHPVPLIHLFFEILYGVNDIKKDGGRFVFSQGDTTGYGFHGDFLNGWKPNVLTSAIKECAFTNDGDVDNCAPFKPSLDPNFSKSCPERPSLLNEPVHGMLEKLPGCIKITSGPQDATLTDMYCAVGELPMKEKVEIEAVTGTEELFPANASEPQAGDEMDSNKEKRDLSYGYGYSFPPTATHTRPSHPNGSPSPRRRHNKRGMSHKAIAEDDAYSYTFEYPPLGSPVPRRHHNQH